VRENWKLRSLSFYFIKVEKFGYRLGNIVDDDNPLFKLITECHNKKNIAYVNFSTSCLKQRNY
jgi:hypothetical protein